MANPYFSFKQFTVWQEHAAMRVGTDGVLLGAWCDLSSCVSVVIPDESTDRRQPENVCPADPSQILDSSNRDQTVWDDHVQDEREKSVCGAQNGADAETKKVGRVLDIGSGTGVIALMVAQRTSNAQIDAVEPDSGSCEDALRNFAESPWADRLHLHGVTLQEYVSCYAEKVQYDLIVSNPPYFVDSLKAPDPVRNAVRHAVSLPFEELLDGVKTLLAEHGRFAVILPVTEGVLLEKLALERSLHCVRKCLVQTKPGVPPKRVMMEFGRKSVPLRSDLLIMETERQQEFTEEYRRLTRDFYLKF
jgi:tRNA1Val (adenine37-N6)-methyltransferase